MIPNNNMSLFSEQNGQNSSSNGNNNNSQFRTNTPLNSNLILTQQQQPNRVNTSGNAHSNNNLEIFKRLMEQQTNQQLQQSNSIKVTQSSLSDRNQLIRLPTTSSPSIPHSSQSINNNNITNNIFNTLLIQQNNLQNNNDKAKIQLHHINNHRNDQTMNKDLNSGSHFIINNQSSGHVPVLAMGNLQVLEAINQHNTNIKLAQSLNPSINGTSNINSSSNNNNNTVNSVSANNILTPDMLQQLISAIEKSSALPQNRTITTQPTNLSLVINPTSKPMVQSNITSINVSVPSTSINQNAVMSNNNSNNNLIKTNPNISLRAFNQNNLKNQHTLFETLEELSNNDTKFLRQQHQHIMKREPSDDIKPIDLNAQYRSSGNLETQQQNGTVNPHKSLLISNSREFNSKLPIPNLSNNHQILRDSKETSILLPNTSGNKNSNGSNNSLSTNDDMINHHFKKSLLDKFDMKAQDNISSKNNNNNLLATFISQQNHSNFKTKSLIDLDRPDSNKCSIKQKAESMVEDLLNISINHAKKSHCTLPATMPVTTHVTTVTSSHDQLTIQIQNALNSAAKIKPLLHPATMSTSGPINNSNKLKTTNQNRRDNPMKSDLPLKKRIMLNFNSENNDNYHSSTTQIPISSNVVIEDAEVTNKTSNPSNSPIQIAPKRRKRNANSTSTSGGDAKSTHECPGSQDSCVTTSVVTTSSSATTNSITTPSKKRRGRIPGTGKNQRLRDQQRAEEIAMLDKYGLESTWQQLYTVGINALPDMDRIIHRTLHVMDLESWHHSKEVFVQIGSCNEIAPRLPKCRSCKTTSHLPTHGTESTATASSNDGNSGSSLGATTTTASGQDSIHSSAAASTKEKAVASFCRFHAFRKLQYSAKSSLTQIGFCKTNEADELDLSLWQMFYPCGKMSMDSALYLLENLNDTFCSLIDRENQFIRECYAGGVASGGVAGLQIEESSCGSSGAGSADELHVGGMHRARHSASQQQHLQQVMWKRPVQGVREMCDVCDTSIFSTHWVCRKCGYSVCTDCHTTHGSSSAAWASCSGSRTLHQPEGLIPAQLIPNQCLNELRNRLHTVLGLMQIPCKCACTSYASAEQKHNPNNQHTDLHLLADLALKSSIRPPPVLSPPHQPEQQHNPTNTIKYLQVSSQLKIVQFLNAHNPSNLALFQREWQSRHQPVIVSGCLQMSSTNWTPEQFIDTAQSDSANDDRDDEDTSEQPAASVLVDCETGLPVTKATVQSFWRGFCEPELRPTSDSPRKRPLCLKLKDWPPTDDIWEVMHGNKCRELLRCIPFPSYTGRDGERNLASHLPEFFVRPDLGPKLYNAYGMPVESRQGTTNLHMDISDAVNTLLYIRTPSDPLPVQKYLQQCHGIDSGVLTREETPGALWHIFLPHQVSGLRQYLSSREKTHTSSSKSSPSPGHDDPIHDQLAYLDEDMLHQLRQLHHIEPCAIVQYRGDAIFIPAGCPHQVRNLHSCMKVATDFVSSENINASLRVTRELARLSSSHANREDKLQANNMIYHAVKDALATVIVARHREDHSTSNSIATDNVST